MAATPAGPDGPRPGGEALRALKWRISNAIYARLRADARRGGPGGQPGSHSVSRPAGSHPEHRHERGPGRLAWRAA